MQNEQLPIGATLQEALPHIINTMDVLQVVPGLALDQKMIILKNYQFLESRGLIAKGEYMALLNECASKDDFTEIALLFARKRLEFLSNMGDKKDSMLTAGAEGRVAGFEENLRTGRVCSIEQIGFPKEKELPDWILAVEQSGMSFEDIIHTYGNPHAEYEKAVRTGIAGAAEGTHDAAVQMTA